MFASRSRLVKLYSGARCFCYSPATKPAYLRLDRLRTRQTSILLPSQNTVRWSSAAASVPDAATEFAQAPGYIPEPPSAPELGQVLPDAVDPLTMLNALGEPTLTSLGLGGYWPPGLVQTGLEWLHVSMDLPWWASIVIGTVVVRTLMFPVVIKAQQNAAKMHNHMPTMTRLQEKFTNARSGGNPLEAARCGQELYSFMDRNKINPLKNFWPPLAQMPVFLSVFLGLRRMANLPMASMMTGGLFWFTDLTVTDPTYLLPLLTASTLALTIEVGADAVKAANMSHQMKWIMRGMPVLMFPVIMNFPAAMLCYWFTSNTFSLMQVMLLKVPRVRSMCGIEPMVSHPASTLPISKGFTQGFREAWDNAKMSAQIKDRERVDALRFKDAGKGPLVKTYSSDPTKAHGLQTKQQTKKQK